MASDTPSAGRHRRDCLLTLRWREARCARGGLRLAQRVRREVPVEALPGIMSGVARLAYADEFHVEWPDGSDAVVGREVLVQWASGARPDLPAIPRPEWSADLDAASSRAGAIDGMRDAVRGLLASGLVDDEWADDVVRRLHTSLQSLPASSVGVWRT